MLLFATLDPPIDLDLMAEGLRKLYLQARTRFEDFTARLDRMPPTEGSAHVDLTSPAKNRALSPPKMGEDTEKHTIKEDLGADKTSAHPASVASVQ